MLALYTYLRKDLRIQLFPDRIVIDDGMLLCPATFDYGVTELTGVRCQGAWLLLDVGPCVTLRFDVGPAAREACALVALVRSHAVR